MSKFKWYQCQDCGEPIGLLGRFVEWIYGTMGMTFVNHKCKAIDIEHFSLRKFIIRYLKLKYLKFKIWRMNHQIK